MAAVATLCMVVLATNGSLTAQAPRAGETATVVRGRVVFEKAGCAACHGNQGQGGTGPALAGTGRTVSSFIDYVRKPAGSMPAVAASSASNQDLTDMHAFLMSLAAVAGASPSVDPNLEKQGNAERGAVLMERIGCYQCHSLHGQGGSAGPRLAPRPLPFSRFVAYVRQPSGQMPPYTAKLAPDIMLADIYAYLRTRPEPPPLNTLPLLAR